MLVVSLSYKCCIRVAKQGLALLENGVGVHFLQRDIANQEIKYLLPSQEYWSSTAQLPGKLARLPSDAIIHVHNEPDYLVGVAKKARPDLPVVYDCHDLNSQRIGEADEHEREAMAMADAYIFPSLGYKQGATKYHRLPKHKPKLLLYSMCTRGMFVHLPKPYVGGVVYEGGLIANNQDSIYAYRDYQDIARALTRAGVPMALYGVSPTVQAAYLETGAMCFPMVPYSKMLSQLSRYDWGLVGCPVDHPQWQKAMPNKLFEYMAAGIPVLVHNAAECAQFVSEYEVGVVAEDLDELVEIAADKKDKGLAKYYRNNVERVRRQFVMNRQIGKLIRLYKELLK